MQDIDPDLKKRVVSLRREFHRYPELSRKEKDTAERIKKELDRLSIQYTADVSGHGIIATIPGQHAGPFIALRADMDALPIQEETGLAFSSEHEGVMHACAHDGHMAVLLGAAELLVKEEHRYPIRLIFQPAEEVGEGAKGMIAAGALKDVAYIFGGHFDRHFPSGTIVVTDGPVNASTDMFTLAITGQGGHGARPHESTDAVVVGSLLVMAIQTIISREVNPAFPSVITVGEFKAGSAPNVIAGQALLRGTIRTQHPEVRMQLANAIRRIAKSVCELHGAKYELTIDAGVPSLSNTESMANLAREAATKVVAAEQIRKLEVANMGGEDFAYYLEQVEGCYVRYGAQVAGRESYPAHSSKFDIDEDALMVGAAYLAEVAKTAMGRLKLPL